jgi:FMN phosphatase YigB (HAD superfamily)
MTRPLDVWDLGGVLVDVDFGRFSRRVLAADPNADERFLLGVPGLPIKGALDRGQTTPRAFAEAVLAGAGCRLGVEELLDCWADIFTARAAATDWLAASDAELWLLSDTDPVHIARVDRDWPTMSCWSRRLLSYEVGRIKVDPGAFEPLVAEVRAGRTVRFFDDREDNIAAARAAGVPAWRFTTWEAWHGSPAGSLGVVCTDS